MTQEVVLIQKKENQVPLTKIRASSTIKRGETHMPEEVVEKGTSAPEDLQQEMAHAVEAAQRVVREHAAKKKTDTEKKAAEKKEEQKNEKKTDEKSTGGQEARQGLEKQGQQTKKEGILEKLFPSFAAGLKEEQEKSGGFQSWETGRIKAELFILDGIKDTPEVKNKNKNEQEALKAELEELAMPLVKALKKKGESVVTFAKTNNVEILKPFLDQLEKEEAEEHAQREAQRKKEETVAKQKAEAVAEGPQEPIPTIESSLVTLKPEEKSHIERDAQQIIVKENVTSQEVKEFFLAHPDLARDTDLDEHIRILFAQKLLHRTFDENDELGKKQREAILKAHYVGQGEAGKDEDKTAGIENYTLKQIAKKTRILADEELKFSADDRRILMESAITGTTAEETATELQEAKTHTQNPQLQREIDKMLDTLGASSLPRTDKLRDLQYEQNTSQEDKELISQTIHSVNEYLKRQNEQRGRGKRRGGLDESAVNFFAQKKLEELEAKARADRNVPEGGVLPPDVIGNIQNQVLDEAKRLKEIFEEEQRHRLEDPYGRPNSIQDVCHVIAEDQGVDLWGPGGTYALTTMETNPQTGEIVEKFNEGNFRLWIRSRMMTFIMQSPDSAQDLFATVGAGVGTRQFSIQNMILNPSAFFWDAAEQKTLRDLSESILEEIWLRSTAYRNDTLYRNAAGQEGEIPKVLGQIYNTNDFTKPGSLKTILELDASGETETGEKKTGVLGMAIRSGILSYYHFADPKMVKPIYGDYSQYSMFNNDKFREKYVNVKFNEYLQKENNERRRAGKPLLKPEDEDYKKKMKDLTETAAKLTKSSDKYCNANGVVQEGKSMTDYLEKQMNIFISPQESAEKIEEFREKLRLTLMEQYNINYEEARYAEWFSYAMIHWTGGSAKNDLSARSHEAWNKVMRLQDYRLRQFAGSRAGVAGNKYDVFAFKRMGLDFFTGIKDEDGRTILEIIQGGSGDIVNVNKPLGHVDFGQSTMRQFFANHISYGFKLLSYLGEGGDIDFDQFVKPDVWGRVTIDGKKANEVLDGIFKSFRYPFNTWPGMDFTKTEEVREVMYNKKGVNVGYVSRVLPTVEAMFGREVLDREQYHMKIHKDFGDIDITDWSQERIIQQKNDLLKAVGIQFFGSEERVNSLLRREVKVTDDEGNETGETRIQYDNYENLEKTLGTDKDKHPVIHVDMKTQVVKIEYDGDDVKYHTKKIMYVSIQNKDFAKKYGVDAHDYDKHGNHSLHRIDAHKFQADGSSWKEMALTEIAAQIKKHRDPSGTGRYYGLSDLEKLYLFLERLPDNMIEDEEGNMSSIHSTGHAFTEEQIKWLRKVTRTEAWRLYSQQAAFDIGGGLFAGLNQSFRKFFAEVFK